MNIEQQVAELEKALQTLTEAHHTALEVERKKAIDYQEKCVALEFEIEALKRKVRELEAQLAKSVAISKEDSLVAAIEGDYSKMAHGDLVLTCQMLERGRAAWCKEAEASKSEIEQLNKALALKLDAMPSGLSAGQSMKLEAELANTKAQLAQAQAACQVKDAALEAGLAAVWDGHYSGKGVEVAYAQAVDKQIKDALNGKSSEGWLSPNEAKALQAQCGAMRDWLNGILPDKQPHGDDSPIEVYPEEILGLLNSNTAGQELLSRLERYEKALSEIAFSNADASWWLKKVAGEALKGGSK